MQTLVHIPDTDVVGAVFEFDAVVLIVAVLRLESFAFTKKKSNTNNT